MNCIFFSVTDVTVRWLHLSAVKFELFLQQLLFKKFSFFTNVLMTQNDNYFNHFHNAVDLTGPRRNFM
jgi:hypothetical protein